MRGHLFENLVILELVKYRFNQGLDHRLYYYRDVQKNEIDVIFKTGHELIPIEIKSSKTFNTNFLKNLQFFQKLVGNRSPKGYLIYGGDAEQSINTTELLNYKNAFQALQV